MANIIELNNSNSNEVNRICIDLLRNDGVICVPTDTVYGLICIWDNPKPIERMYSLKERDKNKPFAVFTDSWNRIKPLLVNPCPNAETITNTFWPGPLTVLIPVQDHCPCSKDGKLGVRKPNYPFLIDLVNDLDNLIANTSFNLSMDPPLSVLPEKHTLFDQVDLVVDGGHLSKPIPSTVIDCVEPELKVLREGIISKDNILSLFSNQ